MCLFESLWPTLAVLLVVLVVLYGVGKALAMNGVDDEREVEEIMHIPKYRILVWEDTDIGKHVSKVTTLKVPEGQPPSEKHMFPVDTVDASIQEARYFIAEKEQEKPSPEA